MAKYGPIRKPQDFSNIKDIQELARFVSAFAGDTVLQFNSFLSNRIVYGAVGSTGAALAGLNYGASFVGTGSYYIKFQDAYSQRPSVIVSSESSTVAYASGVSTIGFSVAASANTAFSFYVMGEN